MLITLAVPILVLMVVTLPGTISRLIGIAVLTILVGITWRTAMAGGLDLLLLVGGATLARRFGFARPMPAVWVNRAAVAFTGFLAIEFGVVALLITNVTGDVTGALPFYLGFLFSVVAMSVLLLRSQKQFFARRSTGSFAVPSPQASSTCA